MPEDITLEELARMVQGGFEQVGQDIKSFREEVNARFQDVDSRFQAVDNRLDSIESEIREIKNVLGPLVRTVAALEVDFQTLQRRVERLEYKLGLTQ